MILPSYKLRNEPKPPFRLNGTINGLTDVVLPYYNYNVSSLTGTKRTTDSQYASMGFGATLGQGATDKLVTNISAALSAKSYLIVAYRNGLGGSTFGRLFEAFQSTGSENLLTQDATLIRYKRDTSGIAQQGDFSAPISSGWFKVVLTVPPIGSAIRCFKDGTELSITSPNNGSGSMLSYTSNLTLGNRFDGIRNWDGAIALFAQFNKVLSPTEAIELSSNPWQIFK